MTFKILKETYLNIFGIPHIGTRIRFNNIKSLINELIENYRFLPKIILDAGCGNGLYSFYLARTFPNAKIIAIDIDEEQIERNKDKNTFSNIEFIKADLRKLDFNEQFNLIICIDVLEHIVEDLKVIQNFYKSLSKNGLLIIHVPAFPRDYNIFVKEYHQKDHVRDGYSEYEIINLLKYNKFKICKVLRTFNFFGSLAWDLGFIVYNRNKYLFFVLFPFLLLLSKLDRFSSKKKGNGILVLAKK
uniref:Class I SAM-dependent methyltransferase n=1 Tax=Caldicellulosiruptor owensensis TaxID=55205 RepID=A0A7C5V1B6_9FIRM